MIQAVWRFRFSHPNQAFCLLIWISGMLEANVIASIDRQRLYEEVWATPMKHLGVKYGISGSEVRRLCDELQIPVPEQGHWTRVEMGYTVDRPPLPALVKLDRPADARAPRMRAQRRVRREKLQSVSDEPSVAPVVDEVVPVPTRWHASITGLRERLEASAANSDRMKRKYDWEQAHPGKRHPPHLDSHGNWEYFCDDGQLLAKTHGKTAVRLSLTSYVRGLALLNAICWQSQTSGYTVRMGQHDSRVELFRDDAHVELRLVEKLVAGFRTRVRSWDKKPEQVKTLTPSGRLALFVGQQGGGETELADRAEKTLEQQFEQIHRTIELRHAGSVERVAEWARQKEAWKNAELRREEEERLRREAQKRAEQERQRRQDLIAEAGNWAKASELREYLAVLDARLTAGGNAMENYAEWRSWAQEVVDELDRSALRVSVPGCES
jgi:hypothetical protein